jgi:hypothetical protein
MSLTARMSLKITTYIHIQCVQNVSKHSNENVTHNFRKKYKDRSISVLKKISADIFFLIFSMTLKNVMLQKKLGFFSKFLMYSREQ